jgi:hypothetical protein
MHCKQKTATGNIFVKKNDAKQAASNKTREVGHAVDWFRCPICGFYHIGSRDKSEKVEHD